MFVILTQVEEAGEQSFFEEVGVGSHALEARLRRVISIHPKVWLQVEEPRRMQALKQLHGLLQPVWA